MCGIELRFHNILINVSEKKCLPSLLSILEHFSVSETLVHEIHGVHGYKTAHLWTIHPIKTKRYQDFLLVTLGVDHLTCKHGLREGKSSPIIFIGTRGQNL